MSISISIDLNARAQYQYHYDYEAPPARLSRGARAVRLGQATETREGQMAAHRWLVKSEPETYSIDDLERDGETSWDGVRNYQARNFMRDEMRVGDQVLFYHSSASPPGVAGVAEVSRAGYPDPTAQDPSSDYHDPKATDDDPRWYMVDLRFVSKLPRLVPLSELKDDPALEDMLVTGRSRLSVQPVEPRHFDRILALAASPPPA